MILYFDNYVTDIPLGKPKAIKDNFRSQASIYAMPTRLQISKYTLASYNVYPWSHVIIKYQIDDPAENQQFEIYARQLYPNATIIKNRSASQDEYKKSLALLESMGDPWVFFAPNNDHPLLLDSPDQINYMDRLIKTGDLWRQKYKFAAIPYSHFSEYTNAVRPGSLNYGQFIPEIKILEENEDMIVALEPNGEFNSVLIASIELMQKWFNSADLGDRRVIRVEDVAGRVSLRDVVLIVPKIQLGAHFEGYEHMLGGKYEIRVDQIPSLFIPPGFFENNIRIAYGYEDYRPDWVNINPAAKKYSFRDPVRGTDLKIGLDDIPFFWKSRISKVDVNPAANARQLQRGRVKYLEILNNPWSLKNQGLNFKTFRFWFKRFFLRFYPWVNKLGLMPMVLKIRKILGFY